MTIFRGQATSFLAGFHVSYSILVESEFGDVDLEEGKLQSLEKTNSKLNAHMGPSFKKLKLHMVNLLSQSRWNCRIITWA